MTKVAEYKPDSLIAGDFPLRTIAVTVASGAGVLKRGAVLGEVTATKKHVLSASASTDGSQVVDCILLHDVDAASADAPAQAYVSGDFNADQLVLGTGHTVEGVAKAFRKNSIFIKAAVAA